MSSKTTPKKHVNDTDFAKTWTKIATRKNKDGEYDGTVSEVAKALGLKTDSVSVRASQLRKQLKEKTGVELPKMKRRNRTPKNYDATADAVRSLLSQAN